MERSTWLRILGVAGIVGVGVLMGLRSTVSGVAERAAMAVLALACGAVAIVCLQRARR